jgi:cytochrome P450
MFTREEFSGEILGFFAAGQETTTASFTWAALELSRNPMIVQRLRKEIDSVYENRKDIISQIEKLPFLENFIKEVLRFHSVVTDLARMNIKPTNIMGYDIPAHTKFIIVIRSLHLDERYWKDAMVFNPDRFDDPVVPGSFMPFGEGPMKCIGFKFAMIELKIVLARIIYNFDVEVQDGQRLEGISTITHGLKHGLNVKLLKRAL